MQGFGFSRPSRKTVTHTFIGLAGAMALSACGVEGLVTPVDEIEPATGAANPAQSSTGDSVFTAQGLQNGSLLLDWPKDPLAVKYLVVIDGEIVAELSSATSSFVVISENGNLTNSSIQIMSVGADNTLTPWVVNPQIVAQVDVPDPEPEGSGVANGPENPETDNPTESENPIVVVEVDAGDSPIVVPAPIDPPEAALPEEEGGTDTEEPPVVDETPTEEENPIQGETPAEENPPTEEESPTEEEASEQDEAPVEEEVPAEEENPAEEEPPLVEEQVNLAPLITDTSYNCDPVIEAVAFNVGDSDTFTLTVDDESPLTLTFSADSSDLETVNVTVDENGIFTVSALKSGDSYLWLTAEDEDGLVDEYELWVVVD